MNNVTPEVQLTRIHKRLGHIFNDLDLPLAELLEGYEKWKTPQKNKANDFIWYTFNSKLYDNTLNVNDIQEYYRLNKQIYAAMAFFLRIFENNNGNQFWKLMLENEVYYISEQDKNSKYHYYINGIGAKDCEFCRNRNDRYKIKDIINSLPINPNECPRYCCVYSFSKGVKREEEDNVMTKKEPVEVIRKKESDNLIPKKESIWDKICRLFQS